MILVDTSVLIDFLRGVVNTKTDQFESILQLDIPYGISAYTYQEFLQGVRNENEYNTLHDYLGSLVIYYLDADIRSFEKASRLVFDLRHKGVTPRSKIDVFIALTAIENSLMLLHNDRDFDAMIDHIDELSNY
ncbi:MAG: PIN domain-containing protein [Coriobacteriia bacterium]|nr:PIN domain-containing protein [Coriobacteriia bacterium]